MAELQASSACPHCGIDTPHPHTAEEIRLFHRRNRAREAFEAAMPLLFHSTLADNHYRVNGYGLKHVWAARSHIEVGHYADPKIQAFWRMWELAWNMSDEQPPPTAAETGIERVEFGKGRET